MRNGSHRVAWDHAYRAGTHETRWDTTWPSAELVALVAADGAISAATVLDLGCGAGSEAVFLAAHARRVIALDLSRTALTLGRTRAAQSHLTVGWCQADALRLPLADHTIDLVTDRGCLHHLPAGSWPTYLSEVARILRPGGRLLLRGMSTPSRGKTPLTPATLTAAVDPTLYPRVWTSPYQMSGPHGTTPATLALLHRAP
jgi:ubiquinone/menaquinone biosynthesis C-methylase UbiE